MADDWYFKSDDEHQGPMSFVAIQDLARRGFLRPNDTVRAGSEGPWRFADSVPQLFPPRNVRNVEVSVAEPPTRDDVESLKKEIAPDEWFYKLDDRERGPIELEELASLADVSGETAREIVVRRRGEETWIPLDALRAPVQDQQSLETGSNSAHSTVSTDRVVRTSVRWQGTAPAPSRGARFLAFLRRNVDLIGSVLVLVGLNAILYATVKPPLSEEHRYFDTMRALRGEVETLQLRKASADDWNAFRIRSEETLNPIVKELERTANADRPIRQHLLWAGRDNLRELIARGAQGAGAGAGIDDVTREFERHMRWLEENFAEQAR
jgi:hypothetical protein